MLKLSIGLLGNSRILKIVTARPTLLIKPNIPRSTAILTGVTTAGMQTLAHWRNRRHLLRGNAIPTVTLPRILNPSIGIPAFLASLDTLLHCHVVATGARLGQDVLEIDVITSTPDPRPPEFLGNVGVVVLRLSNSRCGAVLDWYGVVGSGLNGVATRKGVEPAIEFLVDGWFQETAFCYRIVVKLKDLAVPDIAPHVVAGIECFLKDGHVPSVDKVRVEAIPRLVTVGPHKRLAVSVPHVREGLGLPDNFNEDGDDLDGV